MASKRILPHIAMDIYREEMGLTTIWEAQRIAAEINECYTRRAKEDAERIAKEIEVSWTEYEEAQRITSEINECYTRRAKEDAQRIAKEIEVSWLEHNQSSDSEVLFGEEEEGFIPHFKDIKIQNICAYRRKKTANHKKKMRRNAINAMKNYDKRFAEDCKNTSFCKRRGGQWVNMPKSLSMKAENIWVKAAKMKLV